MHEKVLAEKSSEQGAGLFGNLNGQKESGAAKRRNEGGGDCWTGLEMNDKKSTLLRGVLALFEAVHQLFLENARKGTLATKKGADLHNQRISPLLKIRGHSQAQISFHWRENAHFRANPQRRLMVTCISASYLTPFRHPAKPRHRPERDPR